MRKRDLKYFENLLLEKKAAALEDLGHIEDTSMSSTPQDSSGDLSAYAYHMADLGTDAMEREKAFMLASRGGQYLDHIDAALERIKSGTFGVCQKCGKQIGRERLKAVPHATMCIQCKSAEQANKG